MGPRVLAPAGAPWSYGHTAMEAWNLVGPRVPAQAGASWSSRCTALGARDRVSMETSSWWAHHLAVTQTGAAGGSHARVDSSAAKAGARGSVGAHCPVACLRAPRYRVDTSRIELRPGLAFWGAELLK